MAETTIEWTARRHPVTGEMVPGYTWNPWWGCTKVSPACTHCYAETLAKRFGVEWGPRARRRFQSEYYWNEPRRWDRKAQKLGMRLAVFCASMADWLEKLPKGHPDVEAMGEARRRLFRLIEETPNLDWLLLTKRPENFGELVPNAWLTRCPPNVWAGATVENQEQAEKRIPYLLDIPARVRFLSCEPLLGPVDLEGPTRRPCALCSGTGTRYYGHEWKESGPCPECDGSGKARLQFGWDSDIHWVIAGGESGPGARPMHPDWARSLRDQCQAAWVPFHFKQWGVWKPYCEMTEAEADALYGPYPNGDEEETPDCRVPTTALNFHGDQDLHRAFVSIDGHCGHQVFNVGKKSAGRLLDGREWNEVPT